MLLLAKVHAMVAIIWSVECEAVVPSNITWVNLLVRDSKRHQRNVSKGRSRGSSRSSWFICEISIETASRSIRIVRPAGPDIHTLRRPINEYVALSETRSTSYLQDQTPPEDCSTSGPPISDHPQLSRNASKTLCRDRQSCSHCPGSKLDGRKWRHNFIWLSFLMHGLPLRFALALPNAEPESGFSRTATSASRKADSTTSIFLA